MNPSPRDPRGRAPNAAQSVTTPSTSQTPGEVAAAPPQSRFGKFVLTEKLGSGGMGEVWKAWDGELNRWVALKFLKGGDDEEIARFKREAQTAGKLNHPNIAAIYEAGEHQSRHFIAMQFVDGQTLKKFPRRDLRAVVKLVRDATEAIQFAHEQGVIHRDVKPENLMVSTRLSQTSIRGKKGTESQHHVFVMDFGLARRTEGGSDYSFSGRILGTPAYMSPEQAKGERADGRSDVFSLGVTLYELLTGRQPFRGQNVFAVLQAVQEGDVELIRKLNPRVDADLETIVLKCLEKERIRRYAGAGALAADLARWLNGEPIMARPPSISYRLRKFVGRRKAVLIPSLAALAVAIAFFFWWMEARRANAEDEKAGKAALDQAKARIDEKKAALDQAKAQIDEEKAAFDEAMALLDRSRLTLVRAAQYAYSENADYSGIVAKVDAVQKQIEKAVEKAPRLAEAHLLLGRAWKLKGWDDKAETYWRKAIECNPKYAPAHYELGRLLFERSLVAGVAQQGSGMDHDKVAESVRLAKEAAQEMEAAAGGGGEPEDRLQRDLASAILDACRRDVASALRKAEAGIENYKDKDGREEFYFIKGILNLDEDAVRALDEAIAIRPGHAWARFQRSSNRIFRGIVDKDVIDDLDIVLKVNPRFWAARWNRGTIRMQNSDLNGAVADFSGVLEVNPECWPAFLNRGEAHRLKNDRNEAIADFTEALRLAPGNLEALLGRGLARMSKGLARMTEKEKDGAAADFKAALEKAPPDWPQRRASEIFLRDLGR